jgi:hypothetical protein
MKRFCVPAFIVIALSLPLFSRIPLGMFGTMRTSPVSGDTGGFEITIKKDKGVFSGEIVIAEGESGAPLPLSAITCDETASSCSFRFLRWNDASSATLTVIGNLAIFAIKGDRSHLLSEGGKMIELPPADRFCFVEGPAYEHLGDKSRDAYKLAPETRVRFIGFENEPAYMACVEYKGKKVYVEINNFKETRPEAVTGDNVRFREKASLEGAVIATLAKGTIVGRMYDSNEKWARVSYRGKLGYIAAEYVTGY